VFKATVDRFGRAIAGVGVAATVGLSPHAGHIENLGKNLAKSVDFYDKAVSSMETRLLSRACGVTALESASKKPMTASDIDPDAAQVRAFTKPELTGR